MISDPHKSIQINIGEKKIPVWVYGNSKNIPIIFIHGFFRGFSEYTGDLPVRYLMKDFYVLAFDLPGFGYSKDIHIDRVTFINKLHKQILNNRKVVLFGISYGGLISLKYYLNFPQNIIKIIIAGTPIFTGIFNIYKIAVFLPKIKNQKVTFNLFKEFSFLTKKNLSKIKVPVLLYYNSSDLLANIFMGRKINGMIPDSKLYISKKQNHSWLLHRIDKNGFLNEIISFLK